jgi:hypothetical protein
MRFRFAGKFSVLGVVFLALNAIKVAGQDQFEGVISYAILNSRENGVNVPYKSEYYLKNFNLMVRVYTEDGGEMARILLNSEANTLFMIDDAQKTALKIHLMDEPGNFTENIPEKYKHAYKQAVEKQEKKSLQNKPVLVSTNVTEIISGYQCVKYKIVNNIQQDQETTFVWLTEEIHFSLPDEMIKDNNPLFQFIGKSGFPLKLYVSSKGESMEIIAIQVNQEKLKDELFVVPADYNVSDISSMMMNR